MESELCLAPGGVYHPQPPEEYCEAINVSNNTEECTTFIELTLVAIKASLIAAISTSDVISDGKMDKTALRRNKIREYLKYSQL